MNRENMKQAVYSIFSDTNMVFLAFLAIPVIALQFSELKPAQLAIILAADWLIYFAFFLEFALKLYAEKKRLSWIKANPLDSLISIVIILSPLLELISVYSGAAPLLRLTRISRVSRLGGVFAKARVSGRRANIKSYSIVALIIALGFTASFFRPELHYSSNDAVWFSVFIQMTGVVYALIVAFMIAHVWTEFNALSDAIRKETVSLRNVYLMSLQLNQKKATGRLAESISSYTRYAVDAYWTGKAKMEEAEERFVQLFMSARGFRAKTQKEYAVLNNINEELRAASAHRTSVISLVSAKTPHVLWMLEIILSAIIIFSFALVDFENQLIATLVITMTSTVIAVVTAIIYDMDHPFRAGFWVVSPEAYFELEDFLKQKRRGYSG